MAHFRFSVIEIVLCLGLLFCSLSFSAGQGIPVADTTSVADTTEPELVEPLQIKLSVNEVRLDVVVLDNKGNPVTDLTAKDFEVLQNNRKQEIKSSVYIGSKPDAAAKPPASRKDAGKQDARNLPPLTRTDLKREDTLRTILFVVDDLSMSFQDWNFTRMALRNFVEKQMQPGDMIAILRTGYGNSALQMFISDKREALARINTMRMERALSSNLDGSHLYRIYDNQLSTLSYSLRALEDMPGRKMLVMMTWTTWLRKPLAPTIPVLNIDLIDFHTLYNERFSRLADDAMRAGVVVAAQNIRGLNYEPNLTFDDQLNIEMLQVAMKSASDSEKAILGYLIEEIKNEAMGFSHTSSYNPLPVKTGGILIENSNFFLSGIGKETENLMKGYYLVSYTPPSDTFNPGDKEIFNQIKVNVKRKGVRVYTRDGFYSRLKSEIDAAAPKADPLRAAIFSPFLNADINVGMAAGYVKDAKAGYLVRSWIHVDPKDVNIIETEDGGARINLEMMCLTSDVNGFVQDSRRGQLTISNVNNPENIALLKQHGIRFTMLLPVKKPGSYYVRTAVQDTKSGKIGSAYQYVEIPDLDKRQAALSSIFLSSGEEGFNWIGSDLTTEIAEVVSFSGFDDRGMRSPALRTYAPEDNLQTLTMLYNADEKALAGSEIETQFILYKDGEEFQRGEPTTVRSDAAQNANGIPILRSLTTAANLPPGDYVLQLVTTDKSKKKNKGVVTQALSFTVEVQTQDEFYGEPRNEKAVDAQPAHPLQDAVLSTVPRADISVNMTAGYVKDAKAGYLVRSWMHIDPNDVIVETEDEGARIDIEALCVTTDIKGNVEDSRGVSLNMSDIAYEDLDWIQKHGIRFAMLFPVKRPGSHQVRVAVKNNESGKVGSAWQAVEIPDLEKKEPSLSSIFVITSEEDLNWLSSDAARAVDEASFSTEFQAEGVRSPALRTYAPGDMLLTLAMLYNADAKAGSETEVRFILYKDDKEFMRGEPARVTPETANNPNGIPVAQSWKIVPEMPPGNYVLRMTATVKSESERKESGAAQTLSFTVKGQQ